MNNYTASCSTWELHVRGPLAGPPIMYREYLKEASRCTIQASLDVGFYHVLVASELQLDREHVDRIACTNMGTVPVAASEKVLLVDGFKYAGDGSLHQRIFDGWDP